MVVLRLAGYRQFRPCFCVHLEELFKCIMSAHCLWAERIFYGC